MSIRFTTLMTMLLALLVLFVVVTEDAVAAPLAPDQVPRDEPLTALCEAELDCSSSDAPPGQETAGRLLCNHANRASCQESSRPHDDRAVRGPGVSPGP